MLLLAAASAVAWRATVLEPGTTALDLGLLANAPAVFATLPADATPVALTASMETTGSTRVRLFAPDRLPERRLAGNELPSLDVEGMPAVAFQRDAKPQRLRDPATGIRLRSVGSIDLPAPAGGSGRITLRLVPGTLPARALVVAGDAGETANFELDDPATVPGIVSRMRLWSDIPPAGTPKRLLRDPDADERSSLPAVVLAATIAIAMVLLAVWWMLRGRAESRRSGRQRRAPD